MIRTGSSRRFYRLKRFWRKFWKLQRFNMRRRRIWLGIESRGRGSASFRLSFRQGGAGECLRKICTGIATTRFWKGTHSGTAARCRMLR